MSFLVRILRTDSRAVEATTGIFIALLGFWCWFGHWFGGFLPSLGGHQSEEWVFAFIFVLYGLVHSYMAFTERRKVRKILCLSSAFVMFILAWQIYFNHSYMMPGVPALAFGAVVQCWAYLHLTITRR